MFKSYVRRVSLSLFLLFNSVLALADHLPIFTIIPITPNSGQFPVNGSVSVSYRVTNQTFIQRTLTIKPVRGVTQQTSGVGTCASPFTLAYGQSCILTLLINVSEIGAGLQGGPVVCKTKSARDNSADPFLCAQPAVNDRLAITPGPAEITTLELSPARLSMTTGGSAVVLKVTNRSQFVTVFNIHATFPPAFSAVTQNVADCTALLPGGSCFIYFTPNTTLTTPPTSVPVQGINSHISTFLLDVIDAFISVSPTRMNFLRNQTGTVTVTNNGPVDANNVHAVIPSGSPITVQSTNCPAALLAGHTCQIAFFSPTITPSTTIAIEGTNTNAATVSIQILGFAYIPNQGGPGAHFTVSFCSVDLMTLDLVGCHDMSNADCFVPGDSSPTNCFNVPTGIVFNSAGTRAYIANHAGYDYLTAVCSVEATGFLSNCTLTGPEIGPVAVALNPTGTRAYLVDYLNGQVQMCAIVASTGLLGSCSVAASHFAFPTDITFNTDGTLAYVVNQDAQNVSICNVNANTGLFTGCTPAGNGLSTPNGIALNVLNTFAYITNISNSTVYYCPISGGALGVCAPTGSLFNQPTGLSIIDQDTLAYVANARNNSITRCNVANDGTFPICAPASAGYGFSLPAGIEFN